VPLQWAIHKQLDLDEECLECQTAKQRQIITIITDWFFITDNYNSYILTHQMGPL
jgi:hypothetical protein